MDIRTDFWTYDADGGRYSVRPTLKGRDDWYFEVFFNEAFLALATHPFTAINDLADGKIAPKSVAIPQVSRTLDDWVTRKKAIKA